MRALSASLTSYAVRVISLALTVLTSSCLSVGADAISGEAPSFAVGDEWQWQGDRYARVVAIEGENSVVESNPDTCRDGCRYVRDKNTVPISGVNKKGEATYVAGLKLLNFPLTVGKEWTQDVDLRTLSDGQLRPYSNKWKVEAFEEVKVKAGSFKAFRISWYQERSGPYRWSGSCTMWWSPDVKNFVKRVSHVRDWGPDWELVSYTLK